MLSQESLPSSELYGCFNIRKASIEYEKRPQDKEIHYQQNTRNYSAVNLNLHWTEDTRTRTSSNNLVETNDIKTVPGIKGQPRLERCKWLPTIRRVEGGCPLILGELNILPENRSLSEVRLEGDYLLRLQHLLKSLRELRGLRETHSMKDCQALKGSRQDYIRFDSFTDRLGVLIEKRLIDKNGVFPEQQSLAVSTNISI